MRFVDFLKLKRYRQADVVRASRAAGHVLCPTELTGLASGARTMTPLKRDAIVAGLMKLSDVTAEDIANIDELNAVASRRPSKGAADGARQR